MAAAKQLTKYVWLSDEHGNPVGFGPGDDVPKWAADQIGEHCYVSDDEDATAPTDSKTAGTTTK